MSKNLWLLLFLLSILWGSSFYFAEIALTQITPLVLVTLRVCIAAILLLIYVLIVKQWQTLSFKTWLKLMVMSLLNNVIPFTLIFWGQVHITSGMAAILNATTPLFAVIIAHFLTQDEKLSIAKIISLITGFLGVICLIGPFVMSGDKNQVYGQIAVLAAAISYALAGVWGKQFRAINASMCAVVMLVFSSLIMLVMLFVTGEQIKLQFSREVWLSVFLLAILSTALAYLIYFYILAKAGATNLLLVTFLIPISALILGIVLLGESFLINSVIGIGLILLSLILIDGRMVKRLLG